MFGKKMESSFSDDEFDDHQNDTKRSKYDSKAYTAYVPSRRLERQRPRRTRYSSRDSTNLQPKESNLNGLIFDNGAYSIKINYSFEDEPKIIPNCIMKAKSERKRLFIGNQIDECRDCSGLFYLIPSERGFITKWDVQKPIWDYVFSKSDCIDEIFFEEYEISAMYRTNPTDLAVLKYNEKKETKSPCIIIDSGYSFTHVIPYLEGRKYLKGVKRINVGGKLLTNHLKDIISYRQYHVMEETFVINQVKEDTCYVSLNFKNDLKLSELSAKKNPIFRNYVLPDFNNIRRGYIQNLNEDDEMADNCQILRLNNERFTVPEILFNPSDIAIKSIGISEAIVKSIFACPLYYQKELAKNIVCIGGSTKFAGFRERLFNEVRSMMPASWEVNVYAPEDPISYSWSGGKVLLKNPELKQKLVTKQEYEELGLSHIQERFNDWSTPDINVDSQPKKNRFDSISYIDHLKKYDIFGKGIIQDEAKEKPIEAENGKEANSGRNEKELDVLKKTEAEHKTDNAKSNEEKTKNVDLRNKNLKKNVRSNSGVMYSVKILSSAAKPGS